MFKKQFSEVEDACALAQAMVDTVREPLIVLDKDLRVVAASRSFYVKFTTDPDDTQGKHFYELGDGEWDIPKLRLLLENIIPDHGAMDEYEVEHDFPRTGRRVMLLNARIVRYEKAQTNILLGIEDITVQRDLERDKDELLRQKSGRHRRHQGHRKNWQPASPSALLRVLSARRTASSDLRIRFAPLPLSDKYSEQRRTSGVPESSGDTFAVKRNPL